MQQEKKHRVNYYGIPIKLSLDFLARKSSDQKGEVRYMQSPERENLQSIILYPTILSFIE